MNDIEKAKRLLRDENATLVAVNNGEFYISHDRGVAPILKQLDTNPLLFCGASVADKVIGKAAAMLLVKYGVKKIHAVLVSDNALSYLKDKAVTITYETSVDHIINRDKTDMCPMEKCVFDVNDEDEAETLIRETRNKLMKK